MCGVGVKPYWPGLERRRAVRRAVPAPLLLRLVGTEGASRHTGSEDWSQRAHHNAHPFPRFNQGSGRFEGLVTRKPASGTLHMAPRTQWRCFLACVPTGKSPASCNLHGTPLFTMPGSSVGGAPTPSRSGWWRRRARLVQEERSQPGVT